jgi:hypothetical protein
MRIIALIVMTSTSFHHHVATPIITKQEDPANEPTATFLNFKEVISKVGAKIGVVVAQLSAYIFFSRQKWSIFHKNEVKGHHGRGNRTNEAWERVPMLLESAGDRKKSV